MISAPVLALVLEKENAVKDYRTLIGATNPAVAAEGQFVAILRLMGDIIQCMGRTVWTVQNAKLLIFSWRVKFLIVFSCLSENDFLRVFYHEGKFLR